MSQGRAVLGIGTGWFELEHDQLGYEFGTFTDRFAKLGEALQIILPMIKGERPTFSGEYYQTNEAMANPRFREHIPLMIGGSGEKKTIPLAARHFDHLNVIATFDQLPAKVKVARERCEEIGRDPATLETSMLVTAIVDESMSPEQLSEGARARTVVGSADSIADQLKSKVFDAGIDGVVINIPTQRHGYRPGDITALGEALKPIVGA
jgi:alkanesulfonate monooxygenase SsuD/methylene tetrahydromethanopterin reductase-like flavin-dependent oxidoreductase (luciferase family)